MISIWLFVAVCVVGILTNVAWYRLQTRALKNNDEAIALLRDLQRSRKSEES